MSDHRQPTRAELLQALQEKDTENTQLAQELEATNRGIIALHAELEQAREAEAHLAAIVRSSDDAMFSLTLDDLVSSWNPGAERLLGYTPAEMVGSPFHAFIPPTARTELGASLHRLRGGERVHRYDTWCRRQDGSLIEASITLSPMHNPAGEIIGVSAVVSDLTERRLAQEQLAAARAERELFAEQDRIARDLHDHVIQQLFASGMKLQATLGLIAQGHVTERIGRVVDEIDATIRQIRSTIYDLNRDPSAGGLRAQLLGLAADASQTLGFRPRLDIEGPVDAAVPEPVARHLVAVLREALSNVARHAQATQVEVLVQAGDDLVLTVTDNGRGIGKTGRRSGLANLADRAAIVGGSFQAKNRDGGGTQLTWTAPLNPKAT